LFFSSVQAIGLVPWVHDWIFSGHQCIKDSLSNGYWNSLSMVISLFFVFTLWIICHCCCLQWQFDMELASISNKWDGNPIPSYLTDFWQEKKGWLVISSSWLGSDEVSMELELQKNVQWPRSMKASNSNVICKLLYHHFGWEFLRSLVPMPGIR
jgi:hypothetical protein